MALQLSVTEGLPDGSGFSRGSVQFLHLHGSPTGHRDWAQPMRKAPGTLSQTVCLNVCWGVGWARLPSESPTVHTQNKAHGA